MVVGLNEFRVARFIYTSNLLNFNYVFFYSFGFFLLSNREEKKWIQVRLDLPEGNGVTKSTGDAEKKGRTRTRTGVTGSQLQVVRIQGDNHYTIQPGDGFTFGWVTFMGGDEKFHRRLRASQR
jgi:hypothetical protein